MEPNPLLTLEGIGEGNGNGYVYGDNEAYHASSGSGASYGEAGSGYRSSFIILASSNRVGNTISKPTRV